MLSTDSTCSTSTTTWTPTTGCCATPCASSPTTGCARTSATGSRTARCRPANWRRSSARWACSACISRDTAARAPSRRSTAWCAPRSRRSTRGSARWSACRVRWRCTRSTPMAARSRSSSGCPGWPPARRIGCFGLTEPDSGSDPGSMRTRARRDGDDWILTGNKMWITNGSIADVAVVWARTEEDGVRGFLVEKGTPGFTAQDVHHKISLRASVTSELILDEVRLPVVGDAARGARPARTARLPDRGTLRHHLGRHRCGPRRARRHPRLRDHPQPVRQADRRVPADPEEAGRSGRAAAAAAAASRNGWASSRTPAASRRTRSASASSPTSAARWRSAVKRARSWAAAASPPNTRCCATR